MGARGLHVKLSKLKMLPGGEKVKKRQCYRAGVGGVLKRDNVIWGEKVKKTLGR